ncbi:YbhB/YbcL family Raf kinase inhibitor-like protein [Anaerovorax sp. IOR16]|uniref:YbhB/YbcL family Raf kinase inhibitor-like protein n=1 Tax=Anaerovorax sp. IOR16 TaxID=2773458 RepID=UPI0019D28AB3|nr:YbhB/YbcL family Raf kinase inhibitor-like protein [Anaerovorax sp. IOR16]
MDKLKIKCKSFVEGEWIPLKNTARGEDISPCFELEGITANAKSIAITFDDASHPLFPNYNHWVIWNIPIQNVIPEAIPHGTVVNSLGGAMQGIAYGKHRYKGPKPPLKSIHTYVFTFYILDCKLELPPNSRKRDLLVQMEGHILQQAILSGKFQSYRE